MFLATTGIGMKAWFAAAERWGMLDDLLDTLGAAEILARGPKSVGALRRRGLRELWAPESECFEDVLEHLRGRDLTGLRIVVQEHGQSLSMVAHALRRQGADVTTVTVYRVEAADDPEPMFKLIDLIADRALDAVTFTSAPAVAALMDAAGLDRPPRRAGLGLPGRRRRLLRRAGDRGRVRDVGRADDLPGALPARGDGQAARDRAALAALGPDARAGRAHRCSCTATTCCSTASRCGCRRRRTRVLQALVANPGHVVSRRALLATLPSGTAGSEHAVEMAVARLRAALGTRTVQTVVKRGYRLAVAAVMRLVTVAHGTRHATGNAVARRLTALAGRAARRCPPIASYVELCAPSLPSVLRRSREPTAVAPLLLSTGHHVRHDLPASLAAAPGPVWLADPLGPHHLLAEAQAARLREAGALPGRRW